MFTVPNDIQLELVKPIINKVIVNEIFENDSCETEEFAKNILGTTAKQTLLTERSIKAMVEYPLESTDKFETFYEPKLSRAEIKFSASIAKTVDETETIEKEIKTSRSFSNEIKNSDISCIESFPIVVSEPESHIAQSRIPDYYIPKLLAAESNVESNISLDVTQITIQQNVSEIIPINECVFIYASEPQFIEHISISASEIHTIEKEREIVLSDNKNKEISEINSVTKEPIMFEHVIINESEKDSNSIRKREQARETLIDFNALKNVFVEPLDTNVMQADFKYDQQLAKEEFEIAKNSRSTDIVNIFETCDELILEKSPANTILKPLAHGFKTNTMNIINVSESESKLVIPSYNMKSASTSLVTECSIDIKKPLLFDTAVMNVKHIQNAQIEQAKINLETFNSAIIVEKLIHDKESTIKNIVSSIYTNENRAKVIESVQKSINVETIQIIDKESELLNNDKFKIIQQPHIDIVTQNIYEINENNSLDNYAHIINQEIEHKRIIPQIDDNIKKSIFVNEAKGIEHVDRLVTKKALDIKLPIEPIIGECFHVNTLFLTPFEILSKENMKKATPKIDYATTNYQLEKSINKSTIIPLESVGKRSLKHSEITNIENVETSINCNQSVNAFEVTAFDMSENVIMQDKSIERSVKPQLSTPLAQTVSHSIVQPYENVTIFEKERDQNHVANVISAHSHRLPETIETTLHGKEEIFYNKQISSNIINEIIEMEGNECSSNEVIVNFAEDLRKNSEKAEILYQKILTNAVGGQTCLDKEEKIPRTYFQTIKIDESKINEVSCSVIKLEPEVFDTIEVLSTKEPFIDSKHAQITTELRPVIATNCKYEKGFESIDKFPHESRPISNRAVPNIEANNNCLQIGNIETDEKITLLKIITKPLEERTEINLEKCLKVPLKRNNFEINTITNLPEVRTELKKPMFKCDKGSEVYMTQMIPINNEKICEKNGVLSETNVTNALHVTEVTALESVDSITEKKYRRDGKNLIVRRVNEYLQDINEHKINILKQSGYDELKYKQILTITGM